MCVFSPKYSKKIVYVIIKFIGNFTYITTVIINIIIIFGTCILKARTISPTNIFVYLIPTNKTVNYAKNYLIINCISHIKKKEKY